MELGLRRPDKGQLCAHYVCSVSAGSQASETLKGKLNVVSKERRATKRKIVEALLVVHFFKQMLEV